MLYFICNLCYFCGVSVDPVLETGLREIFQPVSRPSFEPDYSGLPSNRSKLSTITEQSRSDAESQGIYKQKQSFIVPIKIFISDSQEFKDKLQ